MWARATTHDDVYGGEARAARSWAQRGLCYLARLVSGLSADELDILVEQKTTNNGSLAMRIIVHKRVQGHNFEVVHIICKDDDPTNWDTNTNELVRPNGSDLTVIRERNGDYDLSEADDTESSEGTYDGNDNVGEDATQWIEADGTENSEDMYDGNDKVGEDATHGGFDAPTVHSGPRARRSSWDAGQPPVTPSRTPQGILDCLQLPAGYQTVDEILAINTYWPPSCAQRHWPEIWGAHRHVVVAVVIPLKQVFGPCG